MKYQWHLAFLLIFPNAAFCLLLDHQNCQSNAGAHFRQYEERVLNKVPFDTSNVMYYLECVMRCKSIGECLSLNARYEDDLIVCELLDGDSRNYSMKYQENSTYYEFTKGTDWKCYQAPSQQKKQQRMTVITALTGLMETTERAPIPIITQTLGGCSTSRTKQLSSKWLSDPSMPLD